MRLAHFRSTLLRLQHVWTACTAEVVPMVPVIGVPSLVQAKNKKNPLVSCSHFDRWAPFGMKAWVYLFV